MLSKKQFTSGCRLWLKNVCNGFHFRKRKGNVCFWAYIFQRPFLRALFVERLVFGGVYVRWEICFTKSMGQLIAKKQTEKLCYRTVFALFSFVVEGNFEV